MQRFILSLFLHIGESTVSEKTTVMLLFWEILHVALGNKESLSRIPSEQEWVELYNFAKKQAVAGFLFDAISHSGQKPPLFILYDWFALSEQIKLRNRILNKRSVEISRIFTEAGFRNCILKGQGNALMYPNPLSRTPGDIDIWVEGNRNVIKRFVKSKTPNASECYHHIHLSIFEDAVIEVHYMPCTCLSLSSNKKFKKFCQTEMANQVNNSIVLPDDLGVLSVPTRDFNVVFQMAHIMYHFFIEGIGLRHFVDYYYVLKSDEIKEKKRYEYLFDEFGLLRFAHGAMWVLYNILGLEKEYLVVEENEKMGKVILNEILEGGNFGQYDTRYNLRNKGLFARGISDIYRLIKLARYFPVESIWKIFNKITNQRWKMKNILNRFFCKRVKVLSHE